jgi:hypothetical protein
MEGLQTILAVSEQLYANQFAGAEYDPRRTRVYPGRALAITLSIAPPTPAPKRFAAGVDFSQMLFQPSTAARSVAILCALQQRPKLADTL